MQINAGGELYEFVFFYLVRRAGRLDRWSVMGVDSDPLAKKQGYPIHSEGEAAKQVKAQKLSGCEGSKWCGYME